MPMRIHYLEIVTPDVDDTCKALEAANSIVFGDPTEALGNARTADMPDGSRIGVRGPMRDDEEPVIRPYYLTDNIEAAVADLEKAGAQIAHPPMELPGLGTFAIYIVGGVDLGLWQV